MHVIRTISLSAATLLAVTALAGCGSDKATDTTSGAMASDNSAADNSASNDSTAVAAPAADTLVVDDSWVRATSGTEDPSMTAAFMVLDNNGENEVTITGATSPVTGMVQLHEMAMVEGKSVMQEIAGGITLAPGRGQILQPGGMHIMFMGLQDELAPGDEVELSLELSDGSTVAVVAPVKEFTEETEHYHAPGKSKKHKHE